MNKYMIVLVVILLSFAAKTAVAGSITEAGLSWYETLDEGKAAAEKESKLIYAYFTGGSGCGWCVKMKNNTFSNEEVQKKVLNHVVLVMVNVWENPKPKDYPFFKKAGGSGVPFSLLLDEKLSILVTIGGYKQPSDFIPLLEAKVAETIGNGEIKKAEEEFEKSKKKYKDSFALLEVYNKFNKVDKAAKIALKLLKEDAENKQKNNALFHVLIAKGKLLENNTEEMTGHLDKAKELDPKNRKGYYEMAICVEMQIPFEKKEWSKVIEIWEKFTETKIRVKNDQETLWMPMMAYYNNQKWDECEDLLYDIYKKDKKSERGKKALEMLKELKEKEY